MRRLTTRLLLELERTYVTCGSHYETGVGVIQKSSSAALELGQKKKCKNWVFLEPYPCPLFILKLAFARSFLERGLMYPPIPCKDFQESRTCNAKTHVSFNQKSVFTTYY